MGDWIHNLRIRYKLLLIFVVFFVLLIDLGALTYAAVQDIRTETQQLAERHIPRLLETASIKDNMNAAILAAYDYAQTL